MLTLPQAAFEMIAGADHHIWFTYPKEQQAPLRDFIQQIAQLVELEGMPTQISDIPDVCPDIRVQLHAAEGGHVVFVIAAKQHGESAALPYLHLQIGNQG